MKKNKWIIMAVLLVFLCAFSTTKAEAKTYRYQASMIPKKTYSSYSRNQYSAVYKAKLTSKSITLWGSLKRYTGAKGTSYKLYKKAKRTFKLASNVKFYSSGGDVSPTRMTRSSFNYTMTRYNGLSLLMYVKNGKVTKMYMCS